MTSEDVERVSPEFVGKPFSAVFTHPEGLEDGIWRIKGSGTHGMPELCKQTLAVTEACDDLGIQIKRTWSGSPINADCYRMSAPFLDGGLWSMTGNYWFYERGAWVSGPKAVLLVALHLGLRVRDAWRQEYDLADVTLDTLKAELGKRDEAESEKKEEEDPQKEENA